MKKIFFILIFSCLCFPTFSQEHRIKPSLHAKEANSHSLAYGFRASFNLVGVNHLGLNHIRPGFSIGGWIDKPLIPGLVFQGELLFNRECFDHVGYFPILGRNTMRFNVYYLNVNLLLKWRVAGRWGILTGLGIDRLLYSHGKFIEPFPDSVEMVSDVLYNNPERMPVSFTVGGFYDINGRWEIQLRYRRMIASFTDKGTVRYHFIGLGASYNLASGI